MILKHRELVSINQRRECHKLSRGIVEDRYEVITKKLDRLVEFGVPGTGQSRMADQWRGAVGVLVVVVNHVIHGMRNGLGAREWERGDARGITCRQQGLLYGNRQNTPCCEQGYCEGRPHEGEFEVVGDEMPRGQSL